MLKSECDKEGLCTGEVTRSYYRRKIMIEINGQYNNAKVFTDNLEASAESLIKAFCDQPHSINSRIRIMPDVHARKGCTVGTTMTIVFLCAMLSPPS